MFTAVRRVEVQPVAGRSAEVVGNDDRTHREMRLFQVILRHRSVEGGKNATDTLSHFLGEEETDAGNLGDQVGGQVVSRRTDAASGDNDVGLSNGLLPGPDDAFGDAPPSENRDDIDSGLD